MKRNQDTHKECRDVGGCGPDCPWCAYPSTRKDDAMTVAELIEALSKLPPGQPVYRYANWLVEEVHQERSTPETGDGKPCVTLY